MFVVDIMEAKDKDIKVMKKKLENTNQKEDWINSSSKTEMMDVFQEILKGLSKTKVKIEHFEDDHWASYYFAMGGIRRTSGWRGSNKTSPLDFDDIEKMVKAKTPVIREMKKLKNKEKFVERFIKYCELFEKYQEYYKSIKTSGEFTKPHTYKHIDTYSDEGFKPKIKDVTKISISNGSMYLSGGRERDSESVGDSMFEDFHIIEQNFDLYMECLVSYEKSITKTHKEVHDFIYQVKKAFPILIVRSI